MISLIVGTQNSGKSLLAENLAVNTGDKYRVYLATMKIYDETGKKRVEKHRQQREGKGFVTIEQEYGITEAIVKIENPMESTVLLECVANLVGNEIYENPARKGLISAEPKTQETFANEVSREIKLLADSVHNLIVVTNEYDSDGAEYDDETRLYVKLLSLVNEKISVFADKMYDLRKGQET